MAMGWECKIQTDEDELCAWYIKNPLEGRGSDREAIAALAQVGEHSQKFDDPAHLQYHPQDREIALDVDSVGLAIRVDLKDGLLVASAEALEAPARDRQP